MSPEQGVCESLVGFYNVQTRKYGMDRRCGWISAGGGACSFVLRSELDGRREN